MLICCERKISLAKSTVEVVLKNKANWPYSFRWNLVYVDAYADLLWEKNIVGSLKSTAEVVQMTQ
jgi:hypothetical protein